MWISAGNVKQIISTEYPLCFTKYVTCDKTTTQVPDYMQIIGIVFGMITMGYIGDTIGRKWGSVMTVCIMSVGAILLTALNGTSEKGFVVSSSAFFPACQADSCMPLRMSLDCASTVCNFSQVCMSLT